MPSLPAANSGLMVPGPGSRKLAQIRVTTKDLLAHGMLPSQTPLSETPHPMPRQPPLSEPPHPVPRQPPHPMPPSDYPPNPAAMT
jgi:hypothetical protein